MGWFKRLLEGATKVEFVEVPNTAHKKRAKRRDFGKLYPLDAKISLKVGANPKRRGTEARKLYDKYEFCKTIGDCLEVGMTYRIIDGDVERGYIEIVDHGS